MNTLNTLESIIERRPILRQMELRSVTNWGEAPKYSKEYKKIRWPAGNFNIELGRTQTPPWLTTLKTQITKKRLGLWNRGRSNILHRFKRRDTEITLMADIINCMKNNIPFKTKTYHYDPKTTTLYVAETGRIKYSLITGCIEYFSYGGIYDKRTSLTLRRFGIYVIRKKSNLILLDLNGETELEIKIGSSQTVNLYPTKIFTLITSITGEGVFKVKPRDERMIVSRVLLQEHEAELTRHYNENILQNTA